MLSREEGVVRTICAVRSGCVEVEVELLSGLEKAILYPQLTGDVQVGDTVLLNTTAVRKNLGTGGYHFVITNLSRPCDPEDEKETGHIVKLRYTPMQHTVECFEEDPKNREMVDNFAGLGGMPVVVGQLHSQVAPAVAGIKRSRRDAKVAYIMTDSAALPLGMSRLAEELKAVGLIDTSITIGQAFGGDIECINIYTALIAAKCKASADVAIVCPGPGNAGTGTKFGFSSIDMGEIINSACIMGGRAVAIARISFADNRPRHQGISHHTVTALGHIALCRCNLVLPMMDQSKLMYVQHQIMRTAISQKHHIRVIDPTPGITELVERGIKVSSMGRSLGEDLEFFQSAAAAGRFAAEIMTDKA